MPFAPRVRSPVVSIDSGSHRARFLAHRDELVEAHLHLVPPIAKYIHSSLPPSFDYDDLLATGYLALVHVATRYRPAEHDGTPFSAFARPRIRGAILDSVRRRHWFENTHEPLEAAAEPAADPSIEINTNFDDRRMKRRLLKAIGGLPKNPRRGGRFLSVADALAELHEWRAAAGHVEAIAELRRKLRAA